MSSSKKVFISYSSEDIEIAEEIKKGLQRRGIAFPGLGSGDLKYGDNFILSTQRALENADIVIAIISDNWIKSQWASFELGASIAKGKKILPIRFDENYPEIIKRMKVINAKQFSSDELLDAIENKINEPLS